jgi:hypothetical protein
MCRRIGRRDIRPGPVNAQYVPLLLVAVLQPHGIGILLDRLRIRVVGRRSVQLLQVAHEDAFELGCVTAAAWLAAVVDDAVVVGEGVEGCVRDARGKLHVFFVGGCAVQFDEAAEDDALVVGPGCLCACQSCGSSGKKGVAGGLTRPLFLQSSLRPSLMVPFLLIMPVPMNHVNVRSAQST